MVTSNKKANCNKTLRNQLLSAYPKFVPFNDAAEIYLVNQFTNIDLLHYFILLAQSTRQFTIDTQSDWHTHRAALIQIELIHEHRSTILLVEVCHLPRQEQDSFVFWLIQSMFKSIFQRENRIYVWRDLIQELTHFLNSNLFTMDMLKMPDYIDLQENFKQWHTGKMDFNIIGRDKWGLQAVIGLIYGQFLDKSETLNIWSRPFYRYNNDTTKLLSMIQYAVNNCLAVTKLAHTMGERMYL
jgi:hypothetical protein